VRVLSPHLREGTTPEEAALAERSARPVLSEWLRETRASTEHRGSFKRYLEIALEHLDVRLEPAVLEACLETLCLEHRRENFFSQPAPGALAALEELSPRFRLAVVSNAGGRVGAKLVAKGFGPHLLAVVDSGLEGVEKPDPRIFHLACERVGVRPERTLYVGDLHAVDVVGSRAAGLRPVLLDPAGAYAARGITDVPLHPDVASVARSLLDG